LFKETATEVERGNFDGINPEAGPAGTGTDFVSDFDEFELFHSGTPFG
jgi:hypothetical protein